MSTELLFLTGAAKTFTSSLVGMLNCHPDIFLLYECNLTKAREPVGRALQFISGFGAYPLPDDTEKPTFLQAYNALSKELAKRGNQYRYVGDKVLFWGLDDATWKDMGSNKLILTVRDIRTWLCKNLVVDFHGLDNGQLANAAFRYVDRLIDSFNFERCLRLKMEDLVLRNDSMTEPLSSYLGLDLGPAMDTWWEKVGNYSDEDPKHFVTWWIGHDSSKLKPGKLDTNAHLTNHPFWDVILPIFDKYYNAECGQSFSQTEIDEDRISLAALCKKYSSISLDSLYLKASSVSFGEGNEGDTGHRSTNFHTRAFKIESGCAEFLPNQKPDGSTPLPSQQPQS